MNNQKRFQNQLARQVRHGGPFVVATIVDSHGSTPSDTGSRMIVTERGLDYGTVGGGRIEAKAIETAIGMLRNSQPNGFVDWSLKADVGMTCGGRVKIYFELWNAKPWSIVIFGAGHVTQALARLLDSLACRVTCIDPRREWIQKLPSSVIGIVEENPASRVGELAEDCFVLCMTKGHQSDFPVLLQIFGREHEFPFLGVIGSNAKAAVLRKELQGAGIARERIRFHCPVGLMDGSSPIGSHDPHEIAISIAAQLMQVRDRSLNP